jgi:hypothetical protein
LYVTFDSNLATSFKLSSKSEHRFMYIVAEI